jgi:CRP-like cAMP-binding protein
LRSRRSGRSILDRSPNRILASLPDGVFAALSQYFRPVDFVHGHVLSESGQSIKEVYFPHSGIISVVVELDDVGMIEAAMVGKDGVVNAACALDGKVSLSKVIVQGAGSGSAISAERISKAADNSRELRAILIRHDQVLMAQSQQSAACNASHQVEARLCRWLLRMRDLAANDDLVVTQEFLAQMLGVRRSSLSVVANTLQKAGFIRYKRGHIRILNVEGLKESACECYEVVKVHYDRLLRFDHP